MSDGRKQETRRRRRSANNMLLNLLRVGRARFAAPGSEAWLKGAEVKFGGFVSGLRVNKVSPDHPGGEKLLGVNRMQGGDRMVFHEYAAKYAQYLEPFVRDGKRLVLAEVGILQGTGLAVWCELFPQARILGFDIDLTHTRNNMDGLRSRGAFKQNEPELYEMDQYQDNRDYLAGILEGDTIDIFIDDGAHTTESILQTLQSALPHLSKDFVYFVEDHREVHKDIRAAHPGLVIDHEGEMTVLTPT